MGEIVQRQLLDDVEVDGWHVACQSERASGNWTVGLSTARLLGRGGDVRGDLECGA